jgi:hypothetical protein
MFWHEGSAVQLPVVYEENSLQELIIGGCNGCTDVGAEILLGEIQNILKLDCGGDCRTL